MTLLQLASTSVLRGGVVAEGDVVGVVGESADAVTSAPHVHLGVRVAADPDGYVDPLGLLPAAVAATRSPRRRPLEPQPVDAACAGAARPPTSRSPSSPHHARLRRPPPSPSLSRSRSRRLVVATAPAPAVSPPAEPALARPSAPAPAVPARAGAAVRRAPGAGSPRRRCADHRRPARADCRGHTAQRRPACAEACDCPAAAACRAGASRNGARTPPGRSFAPPWHPVPAAGRLAPRPEPSARPAPAHARRARVCRTRRREGQAQACAYHERR